MPIEIEIWRVDQHLQPVMPLSLNLEQRLEQWISEDIAIIAPNLMVIGRQVRTPYGGSIDLLAMDADGNLVVLEIKRDRTPREVVAQLLDYASWVRTLAAHDIGEIFKKYQEGKNSSSAFSIDDAYRQRFSTNVLPETFNESHQLLIVAAALDESTERIVTYLAGQYNVPVNAVFFRCFRDGDHEFLTRAWFRDPAGVELPETAGNIREQWNGEYYGSFGTTRNWECARRHGYFAAGGGAWYSRTLGLLEPGSRIWVNVPEHGYVGVGIVCGDKMRVDAFTVDGQAYLNLPDSDPHLKQNLDNDDLVNYLVPIKWQHTVSLRDAVKERGFFGNQNTVCQPRTPKWDYTLERLKARWHIE